METKVTRALDQAGVQYRFLWDGTTGLVSGMEIANGLKAAPEKVFKTLVMGSKKKNYYIFLIPVNRRLNAKKAQKIVGERLSMTKAEELLEQTGYIQGGCSPVATCRKLRTFIDQTAVQEDPIIFGAGENSYHVEILLDELNKVIDFELADVSDL